MSVCVCVSKLTEKHFQKIISIIFIIDSACTESRVLRLLSVGFEPKLSSSGSSLQKVLVGVVQWAWLTVRRDDLRLIWELQRANSMML